MIRLEDIAAGMSIQGVERDRIVTVSAVVPLGDDARQVFYKLPDGTLRERLVTRGNEPNISVATTTRPWAFDGDGEAFRLAAEAKRIDLAFLFVPMMAVHTSNVEPLPHQITAVYESMLPRQPLRYVLADDPGAGKTIMAGLYIRELVMRADANLYELVTNYVKTEMGKADQLDGQRRGSVGFALTALQRRIASSPEAIFQSLKRRRGRLEQRLRETKLGARSRELAEVLWDEAPEDDDDLDATEQESLEERLVDEASASQTVGELDAEILILQALQQRALGVVNSGQDKKWDELSRILQDDPHMHGPDGRLRKMIIFSEHRDTLNYLKAKIAGVLGNPKAIVTIHGGVHRDERRKIQEMFRADPEVRVLVATDAAGEGVNLQTANLMVNYDLPWNPNRLEQRFGRIHRIGQVEVCHLWNLVAKETREGDVFFRLLEKLRVESEALKGRVFDILGEVFEGTSLRQLLLDAIRYGDQPEVRARIHTRVDGALDHSHVKDILARSALAQETMTRERLFAVKEEMEKAEARRLQPFFVRSFFLQAFESLGGTIHLREAERYEITHVPSSIRERDRLITGRNRRLTAPVMRRYERVCFTKDAMRPVDRPGAALASLLHPGHPLMIAVTDLILEKNSNLLRQGAILVDPADDGDEANLLFILTHDIRSGNNQVLSKRMQFVRVRPDGQATFAGWAPHLDLYPLDPSVRPLLDPLLDEPWLVADQEQKALALAASTLVLEHYEEVASRRIAHVDKTLNAVHDRLTKEIAFWSDRWLKLREDQETGKDVRLNLENVRRTILDLEGRLESRKKELQAMRHVTSATPVALGGALVVPAGLLRKLKNETPGSSATAFSSDAAARRRIELLAMDAVRRVEESAGCRVVDVSADKCGWDLTSYPPDDDGNLADPRHIEVKGRVKGADTITVTRNEILYALNQADKFILAIVLVAEDDAVEGPFYLRDPFNAEPGWGVSSWNIKIDTLLERAEVMA